MIAGLQKMTLVDYPGKVACTVFLQGCNFKCPFCHNSDLLPRCGEELMSVPELIKYLSSRRGLLEGVCVSGGEPTLDKDIIELLREIKALGYSVKLDTNGSRPDVLKCILDEGLVDHVAMDVKASPLAYPLAIGVEGYSVKPIEESLRLLINGSVSYELRTTLVDEIHNEKNIFDMGEWLYNIASPKKANVLYLQSFIDRESVIFSGLSAPGEDKIHTYVHILSEFVENVVIRKG